MSSFLTLSSTCKSNTHVYLSTSHIIHSVFLLNSPLCRLFFKVVQHHTHNNKVTSYASDKSQIFKFITQFLCDEWNKWKKIRLENGLNAFSYFFILFFLCVLLNKVAAKQKYLVSINSSFSNTNAIKYVLTVKCILFENFVKLKLLFYAF